MPLSSKVLLETVFIPSRARGWVLQQGKRQETYLSLCCHFKGKQAFFPTCHRAQVDANWVTKFLSEKLRPVLEPSGTSIMGNSSRAINTGLQFLPGHADSSHQYTHCCHLVYWRHSVDLWIQGSSQQYFNTSVRSVLPSANEAESHSKAPPLPPRQLGFASSLPALAIDSWEILLMNSFFFLIKHTHSTPHKGCRKVQ